MKKIEINVVNQSSNNLPEYSHYGDAGCDVRACLSLCTDKHMYGGAKVVEHEDGLKLEMPPHSRALVPTGISCAIPEGYEIQVRPRSGLALKHGITITNGIGTIDSPYRGDIGIILQNNGDKTFVVEDGDRVGQFVLNKVERIAWNEVSSLTQTDRGEGGYGHTGKK